MAYFEQIVCAHAVHNIGQLNYISSELHRLRTLWFLIVIYRSQQRVAVYFVIFDGISKHITLLLPSLSA